VQVRALPGPQAHSITSSARARGEARSLNRAFLRSQVDRKIVPGRQRLLLGPGGDRTMLSRIATPRRGSAARWRPRSGWCETIFYQLGYGSPADLVERYPELYWNSVSRHISEPVACLSVTVSGRQWIANPTIISCAEHSYDLMGPQR
jgi:hypothetical protein